MEEKSIAIKCQYVRDISFEIPGAPNGFMEGIDIDPELKFQSNVSAKCLDKEGSLFEVELFINIIAHLRNTSINNQGVSADNSDINDDEKKVAFVCELKYNGIFFVKNISEDEDLQRILFVYAPTFLFPYARQLVSWITANSGFPPLMLEPVNFAARYEKDKSQISEHVDSSKVN